MLIQIDDDWNNVCSNSLGSIFGVSRTFCYAQRSVLFRHDTACKLQEIFVIDK